MGVAACVCAPLHIGRCWEEEKKKKDREESYFIDEKRVEFVKIMQKN